MKQIQLTRGKVALVDDADYERLNQWKWCAIKNHNTWYATRYITKLDGKHTSISMHRVILGLKNGDPRQCDHINHNGLDNQRENLRICTHAQNQHNRLSNKNTSSVYKGVSWHKNEGCWLAKIRLNGKLKHLGHFDSEIEAAKAYDQKAMELFGEYAHVNLSVT